MVPLKAAQPGFPYHVLAYNQLTVKGSYDLIHVVCFRALASSGLFYDLDKLSPYVSCNFDSDILTLYGAADNILYGIPYMLDTQKLFYRKDLDLFEKIHESFYRVLLTIECNLDAPKRYREKFYAHGLYGLLDEWVKRCFSETPNEMAQMLIQIVSTPYMNI